MNTLDNSHIRKVMTVDEDGNYVAPGEGGTVTAETAADANGTAPTYTTGTQPLSQTLQGDLRVTAKQNGTWTVSATQSGTWNVGQTGTWNITNISGTISLPTGAATATNQASTNTKLDTLIAATDTLETLIGATNTALASVNASLDDIEAVAENTAATLVQHASYSVVRTITPGTNVTAGKALMVNCTTAGVLTVELQGGNTFAVNLVAGPAFFDKLAVIDIAWSGGGAGTAYVLDTP